MDDPKSKSKKSRWSVETATAAIVRNGGIVTGKGVYSPAPGIKILGAIDYLIHYCGYRRESEIPA